MEHIPKPELMLDEEQAAADFRHPVVNSVCDRRLAVPGCALP